MKSHFLSFATNFRDENPYLKEWIDYHLSVGIDHLYLFDQCGSDRSKEILAPYREKNLVTVHDWTNVEAPSEEAPYFFQKNRNHMAYMYAAEHHRNETRWLLKIDVDEFLVMVDEDWSIRSFLDSLDYSKTRTVRVPRIDFGNNGYETKPEGGVLENYLRRESNPSNYKDIANTSFLNNNTFCYSSHHWSYQWFPRGKKYEIEGVDHLRINHYYTKSKEEYFNRQNIDGGRKVNQDGFKEIADRTNQVYDDSILQYLPLNRG